MTEGSGKLSAEKAVVLVSDHIVTLTGRRFEAAAVKYLDAAAHVADEPLFLRKHIITCWRGGSCTPHGLHGFGGSARRCSRNFIRCVA